MRKEQCFHFRWVQEYNKETDTVTNPEYRLDRSNKTAKSKGGMTICVFLAHDGVLVPSDSDGANELLWVVMRCSESENYDKKKARKMGQYKANATPDKRHTVLVSKNFDYDVVRKIALDLVHVTELIYRSGAFKKNQIWEELKNRVNIDNLGTMYSAPVKDAVVQADILHSRSSS